MSRGIRYLSTLAVLAIAMVALAYEVDKYLESPTIGSNFPKGTPTAEKAKIINVSGSTRPFPQGGFVVPAAVPGMIVEFTATRATHDWDTHEYGDDPCDMHRVPVEDVLKEGWPRWDPGHGDAYFLSRFPDDIPLYDKGTWVIMRSPEAPTDDPQGFYVRLYEEDKAQFADDYALTPWYGQLQDSVQIHIRALVTLRISNSTTAVSQKNPGSVPEGPDAYNKLGIWHATDPDWCPPDDGLDFRTYNTVDAGGNMLDSDKNGGAVYDENHETRWQNGFRYGTELKTEITATIDLVDDVTGAPYPIPKDILDEMKINGTWYIRQQYKDQIRINDLLDFFDPYPPGDDQWADDGPNNGRSKNADHNMENHIPGGQSDGWLYFADAPGLLRYTSQCSIGSTTELWQMFRTGVEFKDSQGHMYVMVDMDDHKWRNHCKIKKVTADTWEILDPAHGGGQWTIPVPH